MCFGSDAATCPTDNLYRIIGVFDGEVKLIKHEYANSDLLGTDGAYGSYTYSNTSSDYYKGTKTTINSYYWNNNTQTNNWSESNLNTINLNTNYLNSIGSEWGDLIADHTWQVGGTRYAHSIPQTAYGFEVGAYSANITYQAKIGLMYVSDYGYAASPDNWLTPLAEYSNDTIRNNNWMFMGLREWTISRDVDYSNRASDLLADGSVNSDGYNVSNSIAVRPSFYLESSVVLEGGTGSSTDPYRIS